MPLFAEATALSQSDGAYVGEIAAGWDVVGNANGGYLMAMLGRAALLESGRRDVVAVSANFLAPGKPGPVEVGTEVIKDGRRFATSRVDLSAGGRTLLTGTVTTGDLDEGEGPDLIVGSPPTIPPPLQCLRVEPGELFPPQFMAQIEERLHPDDIVFSGGGPHIRGWFRLLDDEPMDTLAVVLAADSFPPPVFNTDLPIGWVPTVQMTVHVRQRPTTDWLMLDTRSRFIQRGMFETEADLFDEHGDIVGQARQLQLLARA